MERLPVEQGELDAALLVLVLHHVSDPQAALAEVARALKPNGRLVILDSQGRLDGILSKTDLVRAVRVRSAGSARL